MLSSTQIKPRKWFVLFLVICAFFVFTVQAQNDQIVSLKYRLDLKTDGKIEAYSFSPDGKKLAVFSRKATKIFDARSGDLMLAFPEPVAMADGFTHKWNKDGTRILTYDDFDRRWTKSSRRVRSTATVWDARTGTAVFTLQSDTKDIREVFWSDDDKVLVTSSVESHTTNGLKETETIIWNGKTGERRHQFNEDKLVVAGMSRDGKHLLVNKADDYLNFNFRLIDTDTGRTARELPLIDIKKSEPEFRGFSNDGKRVFLATDNRSNLVVFDTGSDHPGKTLDRKLLSFSADGKRYAVQGDGLEIRDTDDDAVKISHSNIKVGSYYPSWSPNGNVLLDKTCGKARAWKVGSGELLFERELMCKEKGLMAPRLVDWDFLEFNPDNKILLSTSNKQVRILDATTGNVLQQLVHPEREMTKKKNPKADDGFYVEHGELRPNWNKDGSQLITVAWNQQEVLMWQYNGK